MKYFLRAMDSNSDSSDSEFGDLAAAIGAVSSREEGDEDEESSEEDEAPILRNPKRRKTNPAEAEELDKFLFGDKKGLIKQLKGNKLFFTDTAGASEKNEDNHEALWEDDDSDEDRPLKKKFERTTDSNRPSWADLDKQNASGEDSDEEISRHLSTVSKETAKNLPKGELSFKRLKNINKATMKEGRITAVEFHPKSTVGIVAGQKGVVSMFAIDGRENKK